MDKIRTASLLAEPLVAKQYNPIEVMTYLGVIVALGILLAVVALAIRKKLMAKDDTSPVGFTLADLRKMHAQGQLSDEELAAAEAKAVSRSRSHYLGDPEEQAKQEPEKKPGEVQKEPPGDGPAQTGEADADACEPASEDDSSTIDPPSDDPEAENPTDDTDKNPGGGPAG